MSTGERKTLYVPQRHPRGSEAKEGWPEDAGGVDDVADSFDYQNKYAIIQYLKDISEDGPFKQIVMTHNFDFFRNLQSRLVGYTRCLMASKAPAGLSLIQATGIKNVLANDWKKNFFKDSKNTHVKLVHVTSRRCCKS